MTANSSTTVLRPGFSAKVTLAAPMLGALITFLVAWVYQLLELLGTSCEMAGVCADDEGEGLGWAVGTLGGFLDCMPATSHAAACTLHVRPHQRRYLQRMIVSDLYGVGEGVPCRPHDVRSYLPCGPC